MVAKKKPSPSKKTAPKSAKKVSPKALKPKSTVKAKKPQTKTPAVGAKKVAPAKVAPKPKKRLFSSSVWGTAKKESPSTNSGLGNVGLDFIGNFPVRDRGDGKKTDLKKQPTGPVFPVGTYRYSGRGTELGLVLIQEFLKVFSAKHTKDTLESIDLKMRHDRDELDFAAQPIGTHKHLISKEGFESLMTQKIDIFVQPMKDFPIALPPGITLAAAIGRVDPRDAMVTRSTFGAIQELPTRAKVGANSQRRIMQIRALRPDIEIISSRGSNIERIQQLESGELDAVLMAWATLKRLNHSPRFYVALQAEQMLPAACQGIIGIACRSEDKDLIEKLRYVEDSESSWASRCERAFLAKFGDYGDAPIGAMAHRKGTQDPWILDIVLGDPISGDILRHREIGTSRCKPESLADKAFTGVLAKGGRKFYPFRS
jgi:hydroxymethylbilane synthase